MFQVLGFGWGFKLDERASMCLMPEADMFLNLRDPDP